MTLPTSPGSGDSGHNTHHGSLHTMYNDYNSDLATLTDGSNADSLHSHTGVSGVTTMMPITVASTDAPTAVQNSADYVCDGVDDEVQINNALEAAAALSTRDGPAAGTQRGTVELSGGRFEIDAPILMRTGTRLTGQGYLTELRANNITSSSGAGSNVAMIKLYDTGTHLVEVDHMWLNGDWAGGGSTCHGIAFETGSGTHSTYPDTNPDANIRIHSMYIYAFTTGTRHGIFLDDDMRGSDISNIQMRSISGNGIYLLGSPDSRIAQVHIGTVTGSGIVIAGGNCELTNCKTFYCDSWGFSITSGRQALSSCQSQDNANGFDLNSNHITASSLLADTHSGTALRIDGDHVRCSAVVFHRSGGRYGTGSVGANMVSGSTNCHADIVVDPSSITTEYSGTWTGTANWIRISDGTSLYTVGS